MPRETPDIETSSESYARRFSGRAGAYFLEIQDRALRSVLGDCTGRTIADIGGGHGQLTATLLECGGHVSVFGSDSVCFARLRAQFSRPDLSYVVGDLLRLPYADRSVDDVVSVRLISHIADWRSLIAEFCRIARRSVIIDYPSVVSLNVLTPLLFKLKKRIEGNTRTYTSFLERNLAREFGRHGFAVRARDKQFFLPMFLHRALDGAAVTRGVEDMCRMVQLNRLFGSPVILRADRSA